MDVRVGLWRRLNTEELMLSIVVLEKTLRVPWTARRSKQSVLKEISPEYSLKGLMLKLKLQYFGHLIGRTYSLGKPWGWERLKAGGEGDHRGWDGWMVSPTRWTWVWASSRSWWWTGKPGMLQTTGSQRIGHDWATELNWCLFLTESSMGLVKYLVLILILMVKMIGTKLKLILKATSAI